MASAPKLAKSTDELLSFVEDLKRQWMATVDAIIDPLMVVDEHYTIHKANRAMADHSGQPIKKIIGAKCYEVFAGRQSPCHGCQLKEAHRKGQVAQYHLNGVRGDSYFEVSSRPLFDEGGGFFGILQVYRDRTDARRLQNQLQQSEKLASIGLLAGGVAHEINNPLGGILIFSQMLLREMDKNSPHYKDIVEIEAATQRCKAIVENLLDFARQQPGGRAEDFEDVDLKEAAVSALRFGKVGLMNNRIQVMEEWAKDPMTVRGSRNKLIQLFLNFIQNAFQAMPDGGTLTLSSELRRQGQETKAVISISDTGIGIAPNDIKRIFDPFYTKKDPGEGTGLGLAICYGIAEEMGAVIEVESVLNEGSTFRLVAPTVASEGRDDDKTPKGRKKQG